MKGPAQGPCSLKNGNLIQVQSVDGRLSTTELLNVNKFLNDGHHEGKAAASSSIYPCFEARNGACIPKSVANH